MKIHIIAVGKMKENYINNGIYFYLKKLRPYCEIEIKEVEEEKTPQNLSQKEKEEILRKEGERVLSKIKKGSFVVSLAIEGKEIDSYKFSQFIKTTFQSGYREMTFVIGGSLGLWENIKKQSHLNLSFSKMTFPHQLMRLILLEQIYLAFSGENHL
ncbi:23S rRNA (pseudouridine1915-N3)-methyltransferase [Thermoanaerobacter uzonensis DSM 18761]|jgi:23S rRNA (pseudouridine1915-N3)-methyltransferase|uniref:Ribosomal RNA large subunit methyltransferase H n=1 Tax=Thermoanaerobacter uzonensis DSM 18761 TaxID=1123369 RepID=A0A1M4ZVL1_9THEO|nr:23S rRNA (pseudouridine(1915)-N(3))-methyltransferase RlmH [Thermoanaerobacter uzonensis]SHF21636.1 23S rRNA (pseudouridine1915-N3)-methyltransferase [Thermoanaerobacter uzonensis DSM 18761]